MTALAHPTGPRLSCPNECDNGLVGGKTWSSFDVQWECSVCRGTGSFDPTRAWLRVVAGHSCHWIQVSPLELPVDSDTELLTWLGAQLMTLNRENRHWSMELYVVALDHQLGYSLQWGNIRSGGSHRARGDSLNAVLNEMRTWVRDNWEMLTALAEET